jgi:hypothetical protein
MSSIKKCYHACATVWVIVGAVVSLDLPVNAAPLVLRTQRLQITMPQARARRLAKNVRALRDLGFHGYLTGYEIRSASETAWPHGKQGATLVGVVPHGSRSQWQQTLGNTTVGFQLENWQSWQDSATYGCALGCGKIRIGARIFGLEQTHYNLYPWTPARRGMRAVEATYSASPDELTALTAFYTARQYFALNGRNGLPLRPRVVDPGASTLKAEGCMGAASSALSPAWRRAFARSVENIRRIGQEKNSQLLMNVNASTVATLNAFVERIGQKQRTMPKQPVMEGFTNPELAMITIFADRGEAIGIPQPVSRLTDADLLAAEWTLSKKRMSGHAIGWRKAGAVPVLPDLPAGKRSGAFVNDRLTLEAAAELLGP